jgi:hypothetical protein
MPRKTDDSALSPTGPYATQNTEVIQPKLFQGFQPGQKPDETLKAGRSYLAYLSCIGTIETQYGETGKFFWVVMLRNHTGQWREYEMTSLAAMSFTTGSKFIRNLAAIGNTTLTEESDLSTLPVEGYAMVSLGNSENINPNTDTPYLQIESVSPTPQGLVPPWDEPPMSLAIKKRERKEDTNTDIPF